MYSRKDCCWNCGGRNHRRVDCPKPERICCSYCRRPNTLSRDCDCRKKPTVAAAATIAVYLPERTPRLTVLINGRSIRALINTAEALCIVGKDGLDLLPRTERSADKKEKEPESTKDPIFRITTLDVTVKGTKKSVECLVDPNATEEFMVGMNLLNQIGFTLTILGETVDHRTRPKARAPIPSYRRTSPKKNPHNKPLSGSRSLLPISASSTTMRAEKSLACHVELTTLRMILALLFSVH